MNYEEIISEEFRGRVSKLIRANRDIVANSDKELGQTQISKVYPSIPLK